MNTQFIAEVSSNHHRDLERCLKFIDISADVGCDAVKFQLFKIDQLFAPEILAKSEEHRRRKYWELPIAFLPELATRCREKNIQFSCTPFYLDAVDELEPHVDFYKIASYELIWDELILRCASTGKPLILSTGMATMDEIAHAVDIARSAKCKKLTLLHCVSAYPTPPKEANLSVIETLRNTFHCDIGWSDHTVSSAVLHRAIHRWNAKCVEFHLDLDGQGEEFGSGHCWLPDQIASLIKSINTGISADGHAEKTISPSELPDRDWRADPSDGLRPLKSLRENFHP